MLTASAARRKHSVTAAIFDCCTLREKLAVTPPKYLVLLKRLFHFRYFCLNPLLHFYQKIRPDTPPNFFVNTNGSVSKKQMNLMMPSSGFWTQKTLRYDNQSGIPLPPVDTNMQTHHEAYGNACYQKTANCIPQCFVSMSTIEPPLNCLPFSDSKTM